MAVTVFLRACSVGDGVADDVLEEDLEHAAGLLVDEARDALDAAAAREAADGGLGDALDVSRRTLRWRFAPPLPRPLPPLPRPERSERLFQSVVLSSI